MTAYLMVSEANGTYYATMQVGTEPNVGVGSGESKLFTVSVEGQPSPELTTKLQKKARDEARQRNINHVVNLD